MENQVYVSFKQLSKYFPSETKLKWVSALGTVVEVQDLEYSGSGEAYICTKYGIHYLDSADLFLVSKDDADAYLPKVKA